MVGLGFAAAAFVVFSLVATDDSATAQESVKEAVGKLSDLPAAISGKTMQAPKGMQRSAKLANCCASSAYSCN